MHNIFDPMGMDESATNLCGSMDVPCIIGMIMFWVRQESLGIRRCRVLNLGLPCACVQCALLSSEDVLGLLVCLF